MRRSFQVLALFVGIVALVLSPWASAQTLDPDGAAASPSEAAGVAGPPPGQVQPDAFGVNAQLTEIQGPNWTPYLDTDTPGYLSPGYLTPGAYQTSYYWAQLNFPLGATIHYMFAFLYDNDSADWTFSFRGYESGTYSAPSFVNYAQASTSGTPGYTYVYLDAADTVIRAFANISGDSAQNEVGYDLLLWCGPPANRANMGFWGAEINWSRTVSPAPASATFSDVPTGFWAFRYVEALYSSGITAGCGGGNFCPNSPITRAEMAVFLAGALGLHWTN